MAHLKITSKVMCQFCLHSHGQIYCNYSHVCINCNNEHMVYTVPANNSYYSDFVDMYMSYRWRESFNTVRSPSDS